MWAEQQHEKIRVKRGHFHDRMTARGIVPRFNDPLWDAQWYLVSYSDACRFCCLMSGSLAVLPVYFRRVWLNGETF